MTVVSTGEDTSGEKPRLLLLLSAGMECVNRFRMLTREVNGFPDLTVFSSWNFPSPFQADVTHGLVFFTNGAGRTRPGVVTVVFIVVLGIVRVALVGFIVLVLFRMVHFMVQLQSALDDDGKPDGAVQEQDLALVQFLGFHVLGQFMEHRFLQVAKYLDGAHELVEVRRKKRFVFVAVL